MSELKLQQCRLDGRYDVLDCLGRGSYAEVYLARDEAAHGGSPQQVVIKALNVFLQGSIDLELERTLIENFRNEAIALDRVRHPNVINRLGHGTAIDLAGQTFHYLVLEYLSGGTMGDLCRHSPLSIEQALFYLDQVCAGLQHAHDRGVIHRDIKPQNLLFTADRQVVKIADFGVAKIEAGEGGITRVGTDVYAAPEHHPLLQTGPLEPHTTDQPTRRLTPAADVYSLAKTAYTMLTGEAPRRFSQKPIGDLPEHVASKPWATHVLRVMRRATETAPSKRYQSVREFWDDLSDALMPKTQLLSQLPPSDETKPLSQAIRDQVSRERVDLPPEPVPAKFEPRPSRASESSPTGAHRPRIVVPVTVAQPATKPQVAEPAAPAPIATREAANAPKAAREAASVERARDGKPDARRGRAEPEPTARASFFSDHARRWIVVLLLLLGFAMLLYGIHVSIRSRQQTTQARPNTTASQSGEPNSAAGQGLQAGDEMTTTTNVNLRGGAGTRFDKVGVLETGSRVRIRQASGVWVEVDVLSRGTPRLPDEGADRGWLDGRLLR